MGFVVVVDGVPPCLVGLFVGVVVNNDAAAEKIDDVGDVGGLDGKLGVGGLEGKPVRESTSCFSSSSPSPLSISLLR